MTMTIYRLALFIFLVQSVMSIISVSAVIPIRCNSDYSACIYWDSNTMSSATIGEIIMNQVDTSEYRSTKLTTDVTADLYLSTPYVIQKISEIVTSAWSGTASLITFFFGRSAPIIAIAWTFQVIVYYFYARALQGLVKLGKESV